MEQTLLPDKPIQLTPTDKSQQVINTLQGYMAEADNNRKSGLNPRDQKWEENLDLYWNRHDFSKKADWQAKETMPEVPGFVDRFSAALKEALTATPNSFYTVNDPSDAENDLSDAIKRINDVWLTTSGRNQVGQVLDFSAVFEEQMKLGAMMNCAAVVTWKTDVPGGRVAMEAVDPRNVWLDHTGRNLYRIRRTELDLYDLVKMRNMKTSGGSRVFNEDELARLVESQNVQMTAEREELTGTGQETMSDRRPVVLDEFIASVVGPDGTVTADKELMVLADGNFLVRGPEKNPFWHGKDWMVYSSLVTAPLSVYGRSYMEDFGSLSRTFTNVTNMIIDAVHTSSMNAFAIVPSMLLNPQQAVEGVHPNKAFLLEDGMDAKEFAQTLNLGRLDQATFNVWQALKTELSEAAGINEVGLGQFAPNSRTSATEIVETQQSSNAIVRAVANTVETRFLDPALDLHWKTGLQHVKRDDPRMIAAAGEEMWGELYRRRRELISRPITFQARGISALIQKSQMLNSLLGLMRVVGESEDLLAAFMQEVDVGKLLDVLFELSNIDKTRLQLSRRERMIRELMGPIEQRAAEGQPTEAGTAAVGGALQAAGLRQGQ